MGNTKSRRRQKRKFLRTEQLAKPRHVTRRFVAVKYKRRKTSVKPIKNVPLRVDQLALPTVRRLLATKVDYNSVLPDKNNENLNECIKKSNQSIYSKFSKVKIPERRKKEKWSEERWQKHREWQETKAIHRKSHSESFIETPKIPINRTPSGKLAFDDNEYENNLAAPVRPRSKYVPMEKPQHYVPITALTYEATENIDRMAMPTKKPQPTIEEYTFENPYDIPRYLQKTKSMGIKCLALPKKSTLLQKELEIENAELVAKKNCVSQFALKYRATENMKRLAEPRKNIGRKTDRTDFRVSPAALKGPAKNKAAFYEKLATPKKVV